MHLEHFDPAAMQELLNAPSTSSQDLSQATYVYAQHRRFLTSNTRKQLDQSLVDSKLQYSKETGSIVIKLFQQSLATLSLN